MARKNFKPDGYKTFAEWRDALILQGEAGSVRWPSTYPPGFQKRYAEAFAIRVSDEEITIFSDGTIAHDCAPDWDGSS